MTELKRPEPLFRFHAVPSEENIVIIFPGIYLKDVNGIKNRVLEAYLRVIRDLVVIGSEAESIFDGIRDDVGMRVTIKKAHYHTHYNDFLEGLSEEFDDLLESLVEWSKENQQETNPETSMEGYRSMRDEFHSRLKEIVEQHELKGL